jgi:predicted ArsR family transcriptional regulator
MEALGQHGFEPREANHVITLANCPFHALAAQETEVVCGMNLAFIEGVIAGVKATSLTARLDPAPDRCCVRIVRS